MLPQQYIKLSKFAEIGVNGKWYIDKGNDTHLQCTCTDVHVCDYSFYYNTCTCTCICIYMYMYIHDMIVHVHVRKCTWIFNWCVHCTCMVHVHVYDTCLCVSTIDQHSV